VCVVGGEVTPCIFIESDDGVSPIERVAHADTRRLRPRPNFEVFGSVVATDAIEMMNRFTGCEVPTDYRFDDQDVLKHVTVTLRPRVTSRVTHCMASSMWCLSAFPVSVLTQCSISALKARSGLGLLERPTFTLDLLRTSTDRRPKMAARRLEATFTFLTGSRA
jgi:hypothetical protein